MSGALPGDFADDARVGGGFSSAAFTNDSFLGGALTLKQPAKGYRIAVDTVLLAATVPARAGETVLDAGSGSGGAALCLARRVDGLRVAGLELQHDLKTLAEENARANNLSCRVSFLEGSLLAPPSAIASAAFHHVMANPPFLDPARHDAPPDLSKFAAHMEAAATLGDWVRFALARCRPRGTVTFVQRADRLDALLALLSGRAGDIAILPLWPRQGHPARRVIVRARKGAKGPTRLLPGLVLHDDGRHFTAEAEAILRHGHPLTL